MTYNGHARFVSLYLHRCSDVDLYLYLELVISHLRMHSSPASHNQHRKRRLYIVEELAHRVSRPKWAKIGS